MKIEKHTHHEATFSFKSASDLQRAVALIDKEFDCKLTSIESYEYNTWKKDEKEKGYVGF